jgi:hypothetical protein
MFSPPPFQHIAHKLQCLLILLELGLQVRHKLNTRGLLVYLTDLLPRFTSDLVNTNYCFLKVLLFHRALSKLLPWANG